MVDTTKLNPALAALLKQFQEKFPNANITSAYRSPSYNAKVGGARGSQHMHGNAFDFSVRGMSPNQQQEMAMWLRDNGAKGFGYYPGSESMHVDMAGSRYWGPNYSKTSLNQTPEWFQNFAAGKTPAPAPTVVAQTTAPPTTTEKQYTPQELAKWNAFVEFYKNQNVPQQPTILGTQSTPAARPAPFPTTIANVNLPQQGGILGTQSTPAMPPPVQTANVATTAGGAQYGPPKADFQKYQVGKAQGSLMNGLGLLAAGMQQAQPIQLMAPSVHRPDPRWQGFQLGLLY